MSTELKQLMLEAMAAHTTTQMTEDFNNALESLGFDHDTMDKNYKIQICQAIALIIVNARLQGNTISVQDAAQQVMV